MSARIVVTTALTGCLALLAIGVASAQETVSPSCEAAIERATGNYSRCLLRAESENTRRPRASRLLRAQGRCTYRFHRRTERVLTAAESLGKTCPTLIPKIAARTLQYTESVSHEASGIGQTTFLFVQHADSGTIVDSTLTLTGVGLETIFFTDRPVHVSGNIATSEFISDWDQGEDSFADSAPNADFTCTSDGQIVSQVVTLADPDFNASTETLSYTVSPITAKRNSPVACDAGAYLFIDPLTLGSSACFSPSSFQAGLCAEGCSSNPANLQCACLPSPIPAFGSGAVDFGKARAVQQVLASEIPAAFGLLDSYLCNGDTVITAGCGPVGSFQAGFCNAFCADLGAAFGSTCACPPSPASATAGNQAYDAGQVAGSQAGTYLASTQSGDDQISGGFLGEGICGADLGF